MGIFSKFVKSNREERVASEEYVYGNVAISSFFGSGAKVSEEEALKIPAVSSSVELITSSVAQLPIYLYKENEKGEIEKIEDRRVFLLNNEPNESINAHTFKKQIVKDYLFHGASYSKIERVRNDVTAIYSLPINEVSVAKYRQNSYQNSALINVSFGNKKESFTPDEVVIILKDSTDGYTATGILKTNEETLRLALDEQDYTASILKNGALPIGVLKATTRLTEQAIERLRQSWENLYSGAKKAGKTIILEEGLDYTPISMKPNELDLTNVRKHTVAEVARIFNVPESMINSSANKYASNEQNNIYFLQYCLAPIITSIESSLDKSLLLESEKDEGYFFSFDVSELLRTTEKEKIETTVRAMEKGLLSVNEARAKINYPSIDHDYFTWNLGSIFYNPENGLFTIPNMGKTIDPNNPPEINESGEESSDSENVLNDTDEEDSLLIKEENTEEV